MEYGAQPGGHTFFRAVAVLLKNAGNECIVIVQIY